MQLGHTRLLVINFKECFRFYRDILQMTPHWGDENSGYASFESPDGKVEIALFQRQSMTDVIGTASFPANPPGQDRFMLIFEVADVDAEVQRIRQQGGEIVMGPANFPDWGYRGAYLRDPDGNLVEILTSLPTKEWTEGLRAADEKWKTTPDVEEYP